MDPSKRDSVMILKYKWLVCCCDSEITEIVCVDLRLTLGVFFKWLHYFLCLMLSKNCHNNHNPAKNNILASGSQ